jgi:hypothetical protein
MKIVAPEIKIQIKHDIGLCMPDRFGWKPNYIFIPIPKNASSYTKRIWKLQCGMTTKVPDNFITNPIQLSKKKIVVLREPYERYISGLLEYLYRAQISCDQVDFDDLFKTFAFDEHTLLQVQFLEGIDTDTCIFLKFGSSYSDDLMHLIQHKLHRNQKFKFPGEEFTGRKYDETSSTPEKVAILNNKISSAPEKIAMLDKLTEYLDNHEEVVLSLKEYLIPDYNLFNNVQFYNNR